VLVILLQNLCVMLVNKLKVISYLIQSHHVSIAPLELTFSDVWGPAYNSIGRDNYYVSFIDDFNKFTWINLLKHKYEVFQKFQEFQNLV
jgi:hypothetical protein